MSESFTRLARDRLQQLTITLTTLRERVRDAVASELGKAVGEALRDLLTSVLSRQTVRHPSTPAPAPASAYPPSRNRWEDDDESEWYDEPTASQPLVEAEPTPSPPTVDALKLGVSLTRWLLQRRVPIIAGLGVGLVAGLATLSSYPIVQTGLAVIAAAAELIAITEYFPD
ncbi:hypothetical protein BH11PLA2_BH11PLA2_29760 [soil metagenome]